MPRHRKTSAARHAFSVAALIAVLAAPSAQAITTDVSNSAVTAAPGAPVEALRGGMVIGRGTTSAGGALNADGACWANFTPRLHPGDTVQVPGGESMAVQDVALGAPTFDVPSNTTTVPVTAPASDVLTVMADTAIATLTGAAPSFTATFPGDQTAARLRAAYAAPDGTTVANNPILATGCAPAQDNGVVNIDAGHVLNGVPTINAANVTTPLTLSGPGNGTLLSLALGPITTSVNAASGTWQHAFTTPDLEALPEGPSDARMDGAGFTILKDTVAPGPPTSTPAPGRYVNGTSVTLSPPEPGAAVHYTTDGSAPTMASPVFGAPIKVAATETIRAFAVDGADNPGPLVSLAYQVGAAGSGGGTPIPGVTNPPGPGNGGTGNSTTPSPKIGAVSVPRRISLRQLRSGGLVARVELATGTTAVRFTVYRRVGAKHKSLHLVASIVRVPGHAGTYTAKLAAGALGLTRTGLYRLKIVPGLSRSSLMQSAAHTLWIRVVR